MTFASLRSASLRFTPLHSASLRSAPPRFCSARFARIASLSFASVLQFAERLLCSRSHRFAQLRSTSLRSSPARFASLRSAPPASLRSASPRSSLRAIHSLSLGFESMRSLPVARFAPRRFAPPRFASLRIASLRSAPLVASLLTRAQSIDFADRLSITVTAFLYRAIDLGGKLCAIFFF